MIYSGKTGDFNSQIRLVKLIMLALDWRVRLFTMLPTT